MKTAIPLFFSLLIALNTFGQQRDSTRLSDTVSIHKISEVVITANRLGTLRINTPEAINILTLETIRENQVRTAPEALIQTPGVFVQKTNHGGGSAILRGLTGNQTLMLIDGIRLSNATMRYGPNQYFNTIDVFEIERIEVLRGSGSVQYGSDAMGGTIQAFTRELSFSGSPAFSGAVIGRMATQGMEQSMHSDASFRTKKVVLDGGITYRNFGDLVGGDTTGRQSPNGYRELDCDAKAKVLLSPNSTLTMAYQQVHQSNIPVYHKIKLENYAENKMNPQKRNLAYARLNQKLNGRIVKSAFFTGSLQHTEEGRFSRKNGSQISRTENDRVRSLSFSAEAMASKGAFWSANSGFELYNDRVNSNRLDANQSTGEVTEYRGLYPEGATVTSVAGFTLHTIDLPKWIVTAGVRFNTYIINIEDITLGKIKLSPSAFVGNLAVLKKLGPASNLFASVNSGFRAPNIDDLGTLGIVDFRYENPNFNLKPEHSLQYQLGYKYQARRFKGEFYLYRNELYDLIVRNKIEGEVMEGYPVYLKENIDRAFIQGAETAWSLSLNPCWSLNGTLTFTYGQNITRHEPLRRIPPLFGTVAVGYILNKLGITAEWQVAGKQDRLAAGDQADNRIPAGGTPGWNIFNIHAGYTWRSITASLSLQNLLNADYRYHGSGVNGYGRSALLTIMAAINKYRG